MEALVVAKVICTCPCPYSCSKVISMLCLGLFTWLVGLLPLVGVRRGWMKRNETEQSQVTVHTG